jgi:signal transduction histidine kinase
VFGVENNVTIQNIHDWIKRVHPDDIQKVKKVMTRIINASHENNFDVEYRFKRDDGTYTFVYDRGILIRNNEGKPIRMIGAAQDVSERKRLERELLNNELEHQKAINLATVETQEQERSEIGKELHDNVNQVLTTTKLYLDLAIGNPELRDDMVLKSNKNIINVINEIRQLSRSLMNPSIGDLGLIDSIHDLIENINLTRKLHVSLQAKAEIEDLLDKNQKLTIFRIIQEALNNAIKHAKASKVSIKILYNATLVEVIIEDNGIGFNLQKVKKGAGLKNIQNRIYLINGSHNIESAPSKGSKIIINFPFKQNSIS